MAAAIAMSQEPVTSVSGSQPCNRAAPQTGRGCATCTGKVQPL